MVGEEGEWEGDCVTMGGENGKGFIIMEGNNGGRGVWSTNNVVSLVSLSWKYMACISGVHVKSVVLDNESGQSWKYMPCISGVECVCAGLG